MNNETESEWENITTDNSTINSSSNSEDTTTNENNVAENTTTEVVVSLDESEQLRVIHEDLGFICSFIIFFVIVLICKYSYKFFDMFFKI